MGRSFIKTSSSHKRSYVGFLPVPGPKATILVASATTVIPAVIDLSGIWTTGDIIDIEITTNIPATTNTIAESSVSQDSATFAIGVAILLSLETNITAVAVGNTVEVLASGVAVSLTIDSITVTA